VLTGVNSLISSALKAFFSFIGALHSAQCVLEDGELGLHNWLAMFASSYLEQLSTQEYETVLSHIEGYLRPTLFWQGDWYADYKRIRIIAVKE
jgi:hypothetical protein